jgi:ABC-type nitrate/sulfonate/bicarbonate transport system substrate-binding protein
MTKIDSPLHHHSILKRASTLALCALGLILTVTKVGFAQTLKPMIISVSSPREISAAPMPMAKYLGHFKEEGIDPRFVVISSDIGIKGLLSGDVDFAAIVSSVLKATAVGIPVKTVLNYLDGSFFDLVTKPEITKIGGLL